MGACRERARRGVQIRVTLARHGTFAPQVQRAECVRLPCIGHADRHSVLGVDTRVRRCRFHPTELDGRSLVLVKIRENLGHGHRLAGVLERSAHPHHAGHGGNRRTVSGDQLVSDTVVGLGAIEIHLDETEAGELTFLNPTMHVGDRGFFKMELKVVCGRILCAAIGT